MDDTSSRTVRSLPREVASASGISLTVIGEGVSAVHPLPAEGVVVIGREAGVEIVIDEASISRRHARLRMGRELLIEDLGSANGTRVRDTWLNPFEAVPVQCGEVIDIGSVVIVLRDRAQGGRQRRMWSHDDFSTRLEEECARSARSGATFAVAQVQAEGAGGAVMRQALDEAVRTADVVGHYGPGEVEVLLVDVGADEAAASLARIRQRLSAHGVVARAGLALYPRDGREPHALVAAACAAARGAVAPAPAPRVVAGGTMSELDRLVQRVAAGTISILILGETGVGKEVLAERVHRTSPRAERPFLGLNCAALSEALLESELFGHERGAFTGADRAKPGLLETAQGGTVFLDEVGEMPLATQTKLLRVIETREVLPVGGLKPRSIDVRFVAATNRDLEVEVAAGRFRADLYYRLNGMSLVIPPLRQRLDELPGLARTFVTQFCERSNVAPEPRLSSRAIAVLESYAWPGNIRELRNVIERAVLLCSGGVVEPGDLPIESMRRRAHSITLPPTPIPGPAPAPAPEGVPSSVVRRGPGAPEGMRAELAELERTRILEALEAAGGNQTRAAQALGISRRTLVNRLNELDLPRPRKGKGSAT